VPRGQIIRMDEREKQEQRFEQAVQEKSDEARAKAEDEKLRAHEREQGDIDPRTKNSGHGQVTADKWNQ
jgi:hypothetical protein